MQILNKFIRLSFGSLGLIAAIRDSVKEWSCDNALSVKEATEENWNGTLFFFALM